MNGEKLPLANGCGVGCPCGNGQERDTEREIRERVAIEVARFIKSHDVWEDEELLDLIMGVRES